ncbi:MULTISPECIES: TerD family protein [unclassified Embleya]|uniref:TerD family protein n=1 Tax=unclassified Embleya TaxID=2699296 RepID=UPI0033DE6622
MSTELVRGQNLALPDTRVEVEIAAQCPVELVVTLVGADDRVRDDDDVIQRGGGDTVGATIRQAGATFELDRLPAEIERVLVGASLEGGGVDRFGVVAAPVVTVRAAGEDLATFRITDLGSERALQTVELYRRQGAWKVRAVGQGYEAGLEALLKDVGVQNRARVVDRARTALGGPAAAPFSAANAPTEPREPGTAPRVDQNGGMAWAAAPPDVEREAAQRAARREVEKLYEQVWGVFEDAARSAAAYRSAIEYADGRLDKELEGVLSDPAARFSPAGLAAQDTARDRHRALAEQAKAVLDRDTAQLVGEVEQLEPNLPPVMARWDSTSWAGWQAPEDGAPAIRLGDLHLPERPELRVPMVLRLPMDRGLWIDTGASGLEGERGNGAERADELAVSLTARMFAAFPVGEFKVHVVDPAGKGTAAAPLQPLASSGLLVGPVATDAADVSALLGRILDRIELVRMAVANDAVDALPDDLDLARQLVLVHDFPFGFDDRSAAQLRHIVEEGPRVGVHVIVVGSRGDAESFGPLLDPLWRSLLRLTAIPEDHIMDPWIGLPWVYTADLPSGGAEATRQLLSWVAGTDGR